MEANLHLIKVNDVYLKVLGELGILKELSEHFTFFVPGYQFTPAFRNKLWDGKIRLFDSRNNNMYVGLLSHIKEFCDARKYTYEVDESLENEDDYPEYHADKFISTLNIHVDGKPIQVMEHQKLAYMQGIRKKRILLLSPTASGKSLIIYLWIRQLLDFSRGKCGLIIVPTTSLVEQLYKDFANYSSHNNWDTEKNVHKIYSGFSKETNKSVTISTWQSLYKMPAEYFSKFDFVVGDECHLFKAVSLTTLMNKCTNASYRLGTTGTLDGTKTHKLVLEGLFGKVSQFITTKTLMDNKQIANLSIKCLILSYPEELRKKLKGADYNTELDFLVENPQRNKFIRNLALSLKGNTLVLFRFVDKHGKVLYDTLANNKIGKKVFFISGEVETEVREQIREIVESETSAIIVASYGTFSTGINIRNLHNVIAASPSKSRIRNLQSIGRSLRLGDDKCSAVWFDIADNLSCDGKYNHTLKHFMERVQIYTGEGFEFKIYKIGLKNDKESN